VISSPFFKSFPPSSAFPCLIFLFPRPNSAGPFDRACFFICFCSSWKSGRRVPLLFPPFYQTVPRPRRTADINSSDLSPSPSYSPYSLSPHIPAFLPPFCKIFSPWPEVSTLFLGFPSSADRRWVSSSVVQACYDGFTKKALSRSSAHSPTTSLPLPRIASHCPSSDGPP